MVSYGFRVRVLKQVIFCVAIATGGVVLWMTSHRYDLASEIQQTNEDPLISTNSNISSPNLGNFKYTIVSDAHPIASSDYFIPRENVLNPFPHKYVIRPKDLCVGKPFLVIMVCSVHSHTNVRTAIRETWGSVARLNSWPGSNDKLNVKLLFLFGKARFPSMGYVVSQENKKYNDVLEGDFIDTYGNLTLKTLMGLRFVAESCPATQYVLKADEDTFTNVHFLYSFLKSVRPQNSVIGHIYNGGAVQRHGKWQVSVEMYPHDDYPFYASGNTYVLSRDFIDCINNSSGYFPYLRIEDVFVTGIMSIVCKASLVDVEGFTYWTQRAPTPEDMVQGVKISANKVSPGLAKEMWQEFLELKLEV